MLVINNHALIKVKKIKHVRQTERLTDERKEAQKTEQIRAKGTGIKIRSLRINCTSLIEKSLFKQGIKS